MDTAWFKLENKDVYLLMDAELEMPFGTFKIYGQVVRLANPDSSNNEWKWSSNSTVPQNAKTLDVAQAEVLKQTDGWI
jgi:hypothetical protein